MHNAVLAITFHTCYLCVCVCVLS